MVKKFFLVTTFFFLTAIVYSQQIIVEEIKMEGAKRTKPSFLIRILKTEIGSQLDSIVLKNDIVRLKRLPSISHATYQITYSENKTCKINIAVEENFTLIPELNIWTTTNKKIAYKLGLYEFNLLGENIGFGGFYQNNGYNSYAVNFRAPYIFSDNLGLAVNFLDWKSEEPLYFNEGAANYLYNNKSLEILGLYEYNFKNNFQLGVNFFNEKYAYVSGLTSDEIPQELDVNKTLFKFIYQYDNLDYFYQYIDGFKSEFYGQYVITNNQFQEDFLIAWNDFYYYKKIKEKGNWANRIRVGLATNNDTPFAPFALDNNVNLRGVGILVDRGTGSIVWNSEYRHTLYEKKWLSIQGNAFVDAGTWRNPGGSLSDFTKSENIQIYSGFGVRFIHKKIHNAIFRIDYGFGLTKDSSKGFVFGIGQYF